MKYDELSAEQKHHVKEDYLVRLADKGVRKELRGSVSYHE